MEDRNGDMEKIMIHSDEMKMYLIETLGPVGQDKHQEKHGLVLGVNK